MSWRDLLNVQNVEKGFFASSNSYGIPDIMKKVSLPPPIPMAYPILSRMSLK